MLRTQCPSCGAELVFASKSFLYSVCRACSNLVLRKDFNVETVGILGQLHDDGTPIQLGTRGRFHGERFDVVGRIQLQFPFGFWNEWHIVFPEEKSGWLGEAQGTYYVSFLTPTRGPLPPYESLRPEQAVRIENEEFRVKDIEAADCVGGEGELPFAIEGGYIAPVADLGTEGRRFATIDYSEDPPLLFVGEIAEFDELQFESLRKLEGW